jgi:uncharacterized protein (DUF4415 family)
MSHGGARPGAGGKKPKLEGGKRETVTVRLPPDLIAWLEKFGREKGRLIEAALRKYIKHEEKL